MKLDEVFQQLERMGMDGELGTYSEKDWLAGLGKITAMDPVQQDEFMQALLP